MIQIRDDARATIGPPSNEEVMMSSADTHEGTGPATESAVLLHVWEVDPAQEGVAIQRLDDMLAKVVGESGFVSARVLESEDRETAAVMVEMETPEDRARLEQLSVVQETVGQLPGTVNVVVKLYREISSYRGPR
jgi:hypothetical protein